MRDIASAHPTRNALLFVFCSAALTPACGDDAAGVRVERGPGDSVRYGDEASVVVTEDGTYIVSGNPGDECIDIGDDCVVVDGRYCNEDGSQADVVVVDGEVVGAVCFPPADEGTPIEEVGESEGTGGSVTVPQPENGAIVIFDPETDGTPIEGDISIDAERTAIFGNGIDETILGGNVTFASNNSRIRALTVEGNVRYETNSNNSAASFCKIHGNLKVESNDFIGLDCQVFGNVEILGNNPVLVNIGVGGEWVVSGANPTCSGCYSIDDQDGDFVVDEEPDERGDDLTCGEGSGS